MSLLTSGRLAVSAALLALVGACSDEGSIAPTDPAEPPARLDGVTEPPPRPFAGTGSDAGGLDASDTLILQGGTVHVAAGAGGVGISERARALRGQALSEAPPVPVKPMLAQVSSTGLVTIDFEGYTAAAPITTQYAGYGITFGGATVLVQNVNLNPPYPPHSGTSVVYDVAGGGGTVTMTFARPVSSAAGYVTSLGSVAMSCLDSKGALVGAAALPAANFLGAPFGIAPNYLVAVTGGGIMKCVLQGGTTGNTFTLDDFTFDPTASGRIPPGPSSRASGRKFVANQSFMCARSGQLVPFGYFLTGWMRHDACTEPCPPGYICLTNGMNAFSLRPFNDKPIGFRMTVCFYDSEAVLNEYPAAFGQHWRTDKVIAGGPECSYRSGSITTIVASWTGTQREITRDQ